MEDNNIQTLSELAHVQFLQREYSVTHLAFESEFAFYNAVKEGNEELVLELMLPLSNNQLGKLSKNPIRNLKYHLIVTISMITRFCIEGGMSPEDAYTLSDIYIQKLDVCETERELHYLHRKSILDFTKKMKKIRKNTAVSKTVVQIFDYVYNHLHEKINLEELADELGHNKTYLCSLFKKETGVTIGSYIMSRKLEAASNMLLYSEYSSSDISNYLCFSSHSHFITSFKKTYGVTPCQYQKQNYRVHFARDQKK